MSTGSRRHQNLEGQKFNRLTVIRFVGSSKRGEARWECLCDCGTTVTCRAYDLKSGNTRSCGCYHRDRVREAVGNPLTRLPEDHVPSPNEIRLGMEIGKLPDRGAYIWAACEDCGEFRWVSFVKGRNSPKSLTCFACSIRRHKGTKGHGHRDKDGYITVSIPWSSPFIGMANARGYVLEHRLVMAQCLNRCLLPTECVHHLNGDRKDNRIENLQLMTNQDHVSRHLGVPYTERIVELEARIKELESQHGCIAVLPEPVDCI
jgi:hypothetical protein